MSLSSLDWCLIIGINAAIILFGLFQARGTRSSVDWFLAAKGLPWWMVGLSMFATAVDSGDYVAVAGGAYEQGMGYISVWWLGISIGWCLVAYIVFVPMYRAGLFTNAEYLEYRFGPVARVISVLVQIQSRTNVMANVAFSLYLTFSILTGWGEQTWWLVAGIALGAAVYTATGGLKSVAVTDTIQSLVMTLASLALWWTVWNAVGGWHGMQDKLATHVEAGQLEAGTAEAMVHVGSSEVHDAPIGIVLIGYVIVLTAYCTINQSQAMRLLAARSVWDMKMAAIVAGSVTAVVMWFNVTLGIMGRAVFPSLDRPDEVFPRLIEEFLPALQSGLMGIVVAGLLAGGLSTYDSIGSAISSVFTRDIYARFFVTQREDRHYLWVSRIVTLVVIAASFVYIPFLKSGMVTFYMKITGVAVVPLFTVYVMGALTRVARCSASVGLILGIACGLTRFMDPVFQQLGNFSLPIWWTSIWWGYLWSILVTAATMVMTTMVVGWPRREEIQGWTFATSENGEMPRLPETGVSHKSTWLEQSRQQIPSVPKSAAEIPTGPLAWIRSPLIWALALLLIVGYLNLVVFW